MPKYPDVTVQVVAEHYDRYLPLLADVRVAIQAHGATFDEVHELLVDAMSGDVDHPFEVCREWVNLKEREAGCVKAIR